MKRTPVMIGVLLIGIGTFYAAVAQDSKPAPKTWNFDSDKAGTVAGQFSSDVGQWVVLEDADAPSKPNVFAQQAQNEKAVYNVALLDKVHRKDVDITVKFRSVSGDIDQGGGVVWRAKDAQNYYIARYNPLEENFRLYTVLDGKRNQLATAPAPKADGWHTLRVTMSDHHIVCWFNGAEIIKHDDAAIADAGKVGLWTKADAQTQFDDFTLAMP